MIAYIDTRQLQASADDARAALAKAELDMNRYKALADQKMPLLNKPMMIL